MIDIPLTPTQRSLLGLDPTATLSPSPGTQQQYVTPPRYPRSPTSRNISPLATTSRSPGSNYSTSITNSPSFGREGSDSPGGNLAASPLWQKSLGKSAAMRRSSYGSPSPLGPGNGVLGRRVHRVRRLNEGRAWRWITSGFIRRGEALRGRGSIGIRVYIRRILLLIIKAVSWGERGVGGGLWLKLATYVS